VTNNTRISFQEETKLNMEAEEEKTYMQQRRASQEGAPLPQLGLLEAALAQLGLLAMALATTSSVNASSLRPKDCTWA